MWNKLNNAITPQKAAKIWVTLTIASLALFFLFSSLTYSKIDAISIWVLTCISMLYFSKKDQMILGKKGQVLVILAGLGIVIFSFLNVPLGLGNPPYSIAEFSLLLSGISMIVFGLLTFRPLIPPTTSLTTGVIRIMGFDAEVHGNIISYLSISGEPIRLAVVSDCTGIWSLGTFTVAAIIVLATFPEAISRKGALLLFIGYIGTYASNIGRITIITLSGYLYGPEGVIEQVHIHTGWILFTIWMVVFWYYFFTRHLGFSFSMPNKPTEEE